jgi:anti-anti-sigma factor
VSTLDVEVTGDGQIVSVALTGELDISGAPALKDRLIDLERRRPRVLVLDLRELSFVDSSGLRLILEADLRARREGRRFAIVRGPDFVHRVFSIALLDSRLDIVDDPAEIDPSAVDVSPAPPV